MSARFMQRIDRKAKTESGIFGGDEPSTTSPTSIRSSRSTRERSTTPSSQTSRLDSSPLSRDEIRVRSCSIDKPIAPKESLILVTGANGFHGSHIVDQLLQYGYRVRGTVRDKDEAEMLSNRFTSTYGSDRFEATVVPDMAVKDAFCNVVRGCAGMIHCASVTSMSCNPSEVVTPTTAGALTALEAAAAEPSIRRFIYTSSVAAAASYRDRDCSDITSDSWNMLDMGEVCDATPYIDSDVRALAVYSCSKMQTEACVWRWYDVHKPAFAVNTSRSAHGTCTTSNADKSLVLPGTLSGEVLTPGGPTPRFTTALRKAVNKGEHMTGPSRKHQREVWSRHATLTLRCRFHYGRGRLGLTARRCAQSSRCTYPTHLCHQRAMDQANIRSKQ